MRLVTASFLLPESATAPDVIVYVPEGRNTITPRSQPDGITFNVDPERGEQIADTLDAQLQAMKQRNVQPWIDFEHTRKAPVSGYPQAFSYEKGKGIMCSMQWSGSGKKAVEARDVRYFSPEVYIDDQGVPVGLPDQGPLGGLVAEPAFRSITPVVASQAGAEDTEDEPTKKPDMKLILATCGLLTDSEAALTDAESLASKRVKALRDTAEKITLVEASLVDAQKERDDWKGKYEALEQKQKADSVKHAETLVQAAVADGRIAANDEKTKGFFQRLITAGDADAEETLKKLPVLHEGIDKQLVTAGQGDRQTLPAGEHAFVTKARKLVTAGQAKTLDEAFSHVAMQEPKAYDEYLASLS